MSAALLAGLLAGIAGGAVGTLVVARRMASISGGLAHAAFGGVGLGYLLGFDPMLGATLFAVAGGLAIAAARPRLQAAFDTLIAMVWAGGMALGMLFVALAPGTAPDIEGFLFGDILRAAPPYLAAAAALDVAIVALGLLLYKELLATSFDEDFAEVAGVPVQGLTLLLLGLVGLTVVILIRVVGVILVIALVTVPAATARHFTRTLGGTMALAAVLGVALCEAGLVAAGALAVPPGPVIVLLGIALYLASAGGRRLGGGR